MSALNIEVIRKDFPILSLKINDKPLIYLDNAASSQMPEVVIQRINYYHQAQHANINRGVHYLSELATFEYELARKKVQQFINAKEEREIIFSSGTTESLNLVMHGYGRKFIQRDDEIILTMLEHHSNIVPWQMLANERGCLLRVVLLDINGDLNFEDYQKLFNPRTKLVALCHASNAIGTLNPLKLLIEFAHQQNVAVVVDGAQAAAHLNVDVQELDCDFYAFSGHKLYGPTGIGVLYAKAHLLEEMQPFKGGGGMISTVSFTKTSYQPIPHKFEAGTPPIAAAIGMGAAIDYIQKIGLAAISAYEQALLEYALRQFAGLGGVKIIATPKQRVALLSFVVDGIHPHDVGTLLNLEGIAVRSGHHCAQPLLAWLGLAATTRASFAFYNTFAEIDSLIAGIKLAQKVFS